MKLKAEQKWVNIMINSVSTNLIAFILLFVIHRMTTAIIALIYHIPTVIFTNRTVFIATPELWTFDSIKMIFSTGIIALIVWSILLMVFFLRTIEYNGLIRTFMIWGFVLGISYTFGSVILGAFLYEGTGYIFAWLYLTETTKMLLLFGGILILLIIGTLMSRSMLFTANSYFNYLSPVIRTTFIKWQFIYPYLISVAILLLVRIPLTLYESLLLLTPIFTLIPLYWAIERHSVYYFEEGHKPHNINYFLVAVAIGMLIIFVTIFSIGVRLY